jgi:hypothetical protein
LLIGQLPRVEVWAVTVDDEEPLEVAPDDALEPVDDDGVGVALLVAAAAICVVVVGCRSCQARTPPSASVAATLMAVAAFRARAARGLRRGRSAPVARGRRGGGVGVCWFMTTNLGTPCEGATRAG